MAMAMPKPGKYIICAVGSCHNTAKTRPDLSFFAIPTDEGVAQDWLQRILPEGYHNLEHCLSNEVCEEHFVKDVILHVGNRKALKKTARPTEKLPKPLIDEDVLEIVSVNKSSKLIQTDDDKEIVEVEHSFESERENKALHIIYYQLADLFLIKELAILLQTVECLKYKFNHYKSNDEDFMRFYLNLYQNSPMTYQLTQNMYNLPEENVLLKEFIKPGTKVCHDTIATIKARVDKMSRREKNCSLLIKAVPIKANLCYNIREDKIYGFEEIDGIQNLKPAKTAIVVMIKGIFAIWKLFVGYILISKDCDETIIANWIDTVLKDLFSIGLNVRTCVLSNKENFIYKKVVSTKSPFFYHQGKKIYLIHDALDHMISIRNSWQNQDIHFDDKVAKYKDIVKFFKVDRKRPIPYAHKLTEIHINPLKEQKQNVKYAAQIMSRTVAHGLWNYVNFGWIKNSAGIGTVEFILRVNDLFDALNARKRNKCDDDNDRKKPLCEGNSQKDFLEETIQYFQNLRVVNPKDGQDLTSSAEFINGILISLKSILFLFEDLKTEGYNVLWTGNLQRKALDNNIEQMHSILKNKKHGNSLTAWQFTTESKKKFYLGLKMFVQGSRCKTDGTSFIAQIRKVKEEMDNDTAFSLDQIADLSLPTKAKSHESAESSSKSIRMIKKEDYCKLDVEQCQYLLYVCEYIVTKVTTIHSQCDMMEDFFNANKQDLDAVDEDTKIGTVARFKNYIQQMDNKFVAAFTKNLQTRIASSLYKEMENIDYNAPCPCFPKEFVIALFIRIRIFHIIRFNNTEYKKNKLSHSSFIVEKLA